MTYLVGLCYFCYTLLYSAILYYFSSYFIISCHTERSEVSINSKHILNFFGFFARFTHSKWQRLAPCNPLGRFLAKAQNDKGFVILTFLSYQTLFVSYWAQRSIHEFKACLKFCGFFATLKMTRILGFSLSSKNSKRQNKPSLWALWIQGVAIHNFNLIFACGLSRHFCKRLALTDKTPRLKFAKFAMTIDKTNSLKFFCKTA